MAPDFLELPVVHCRGSARDLGRAQGESSRDKIHRFLEQRWEALSAYLAERHSASLSRFMEIGQRAFKEAEQWDPEGMIEHVGIAEGARVDPVRLYAITNMTDLRDALLWSPEADSEGCSAFALPKQYTDEGVIIAGQTWDLNPMDLDYVVAVHRQPSQGFETWSITCVGCLSLIGMNSEGLGVGTTNIKTRRTRPGVGYLSLVHRALRSRSREEAALHLAAAPRAAAHTYWIADPDGALELECDAESAVRRDLTDAPLARTNHCLDPSFCAEEGETPNASSFERFERLGELLRRGHHDVSSLQAVFADRSRGVLSINRYPEDEQGTTTNACTLMLPARREFWACRGSADRGAWQRLAFESAS